MLRSFKKDFPKGETILIENIIWSRNDEEMARTRVRWTSMILFISIGELKIINPQLQIKVLLAKLTPRGLLLGWALWKTFIK
jgi:DNA mismatch repair protein MutH